MRGWEEEKKGKGETGRKGGGARRAARDEKEEQGQRTGENAKKEERPRGSVGVLLPADLSY